MALSHLFHDFDEKGRILQQTDYYPLGLEIDRNAPVQTKAARNNVNRFLYNGKELQVGSGYLDYGARMYMPEIGQMGSIDGAAHFMTMILPGAFSPTFRPGPIPTTIPKMTSLAIPVAYNALDTYLKGPSAIEHIAQLLKGMGVPSDLLRGPAIRNAKPTPKNNREEFIKLPGNQGWVNKKTGEIYKKKPYQSWKSRKCANSDRH
jgi:hypothetical protein